MKAAATEAASQVRKYRISWPLFLLSKTYKGSLYLLATLEKTFDIIFTLVFLLESSKLCPVSNRHFCFPEATPTLR